MSVRELKEDIDRVIAGETMPDGEPVEDVIKRIKEGNGTLSDFTLIEQFYDGLWMYGGEEALEDKKGGEIVAHDGLRVLKTTYDLIGNKEQVIEALKYFIVKMKVTIAVRKNDRKILREKLMTLGIQDIRRISLDQIKALNKLIRIGKNTDLIAFYLEHIDMESMKDESMENINEEWVNKKRNNIQLFSRKISAVEKVEDREVILEEIRKLSKPLRNMEDMERGKAQYKIDCERQSEKSLLAKAKVKSVKVQLEIVSEEFILAETEEKEAKEALESTVKEVGAIEEELGSASTSTLKITEGIAQLAEVKALEAMRKDAKEMCWDELRLKKELVEKVKVRFEMASKELESKETELDVVKGELARVRSDEEEQSEQVLRIKNTYEEAINSFDHEKLETAREMRDLIKALKKTFPKIEKAIKPDLDKANEVVDKFLETLRTTVV